MWLDISNMPSSAVVISLVLLWQSWYDQSAICHFLWRRLNSIAINLFTTSGYDSSHQIKNNTASLPGHYLVEHYGLTLAIHAPALYQVQHIYCWTLVN